MQQTLDPCYSNIFAEANFVKPKNTLTFEPAVQMLVTDCNHSSWLSCRVEKSSDHHFSKLKLRLNFILMFENIAGQELNLCNTGSLIPKLFNIISERKSLVGSGHVAPRWHSFLLKFTQLSILPGLVKWVPAYMDCFEMAARGAYNICFSFMSKCASEKHSFDKGCTKKLNESPPLSMEPQKAHGSPKDSWIQNPGEIAV